MEHNYGTNLFDDIKTVELMKLFRENIKKVGFDACAWHTEYLEFRFLCR